MQAIEVIKLLLNIGTPAIGKLIYYDALTASTKHFNLKRDPQCVVCGDNPTLTEIKEITIPCNSKSDDMKEIDVFQLRDQLNDNTIEFLLDVRMPHEYEAANLKGKLIPLPELEDQLDTLPRDKAIVIHCKGGVRSAKACQILLAAGFTDVTNVAGGTDAWRKHIDPSLPPA